ncbi:hypothetical protein ACA910_008317 [Epithemia clementina (nom. ined.)]
MGTPSSVVVEESRLSNKDQKKIEKLRTQIPFHVSRGNTDEVFKIREQINSIVSKAVVDDETAELTEIADSCEIGMGIEVEEVDEADEEKEWEDFREERLRVLADAKSIKQMAGFFLHPEAAVKVDGYATARCYFDRASGPVNPEILEEQEWEGFLAERRRILQDAQNLKQMASFFLHPEAPVKADGFATARCYFDRASAPLDPEVVEEQEWKEFLEERRRVLEDARSLKQMAEFYHHPEAPVKVDGCATARCYFDRASAPEDPEMVEEKEWKDFCEERRSVLQDAANLKQMAKYYLNPGAPVEVDGFATARCYFDRASAPVASDEMEDKEWEDFRDERRRVLDDARILKKMAGFYHHPEAPVEVDAFATARCYFDRASAPAGNL